MSDPILTWNANKTPWPTSWDGKPAFKCDKMARPNTRGRYITWEVKEPQEHTPRRKIARLVKPAEKIEPLDHQVAIKNSYDNPKFDLMLPKSMARMRTRLTKIFSKLGVGFLDAREHTYIQRINAPACWATGRKEGEEYIFVHPFFLMQRMTWARFLLLREIAHRALSRGRTNLRDRQLRQLVFDICVNRLMAQNTTGKPNASWRKFCEWIYPQKSKDSVLALCNASLTDHELRKLEAKNPIYGQIWRQLYELQTGDFKHTNPRTGRESTRKLRGVLPFEIQRLSPDELYFRIKGQLTEEDRAAMQPIGYEEEDPGIMGVVMEDGVGRVEMFTYTGLNPFGMYAHEVEIKATGGTPAQLHEDAPDVASESGGRMEQAVRKWMVPRRFQFSSAWKAFSDCRTNFWDRWVKKPEDIVDPELEKYAKKIKTDRVMMDVVGNVVQGLVGDVALDTYPKILTEEGMMLAMCGLTPENGYPFYHNLDGPQGKRRVIAFFDLSPSMAEFFAYMSYMCKSFEDKMDMIFARTESGDDGVMSFAGSVKTLTHQELTEMRRGELKTGASTSFNSVVEFCCDEIETEDVDAVIIFTDGESGVSEENVERFNASGKKMYRIYFQDDDPRNRGRTIESDLDRLNGESYTVTAPRTDAM